MNDIADKAHEVEELLRETALRQRKSTAHVPRKGDGKCLNCGAAVPPERRWCDATCRDDWEKSQ